jgi:hypothetical protein
MSEWISVDQQLPGEGQNVIAVGTWYGEIIGRGEREYIGMGAWKNGVCCIDNDLYCIEIIDVTHWMPILKHP